MLKVNYDNLFEVLRSPFFFIFPEIRKVTLIGDSIIKNVSGLMDVPFSHFVGIKSPSWQTKYSVKWRNYYHMTM